MVRFSFFALLLVASLSTGCGRTGLFGDAVRDDHPCEDTACAPGGLYPGPCTHEHRSGADGALKQGASFFYDERCLPVSGNHDLDGDGEADYFVLRTHDEHDLLVTELRFRGPELSEVWSYDHDEDGNLLLLEVDQGGDDTIDFRVEYDRNERGDVVEERSYAGDELTGWTVTTYDDEGGVVTVEEHQHFCIDWTVFTGDVVARRTTYTNDGAGHVTVEVDGVECFVADGELDMRIERTFDGDGNLIAEDVDGTPVSPGYLDGVYDSCTRYTYDGHGLLVRIAWDGGNAGPYGEVRLCDGVADGISVRVHDDAGREIRIENDHDADGDIEMILFFEFDPCGNLTGKSSWREAEDRIVWFDIYGYDCWD